MENKELYVRESYLYSEEELKEALGFSTMSQKKYDAMIEALKVRRILRTRKKRGSKELYNDDASLIAEGDAEYDDYIGEESNKLQYTFRFVGFFYYGDRVVYVYPKYIDSTTTPQKEMKKVIRVLLKYQGKKNYYNVPEYIEKSENGKELSELSLILFLLNDYSKNGVYIEDESVDEINGEGDIKWGKTVDLIDPVIVSGDTPYYFDVYTNRIVDNDNNFCTRLHKFVLSNATKELDEIGISDVFDLPYLDLTEDEEEYFGDAQNMLEQIDRELRVQFDDRKVTLLRALELYVKLRYEKDDIRMKGSGESLEFFGTRYFHEVWEDIINEVYKSQRDLSLGEIKSKHTAALQYELKLPNGMKVSLDQDLTLEGVIEKPIWNITDPDTGVVGRYLPNGSFKPDYLSFDKGCTNFYIIDAKYYVPRFYENKLGELRVERQPGVEDVAKQYMYYLSYKRLLDRNMIGIRNVKNYFVMPTEGNTHDIGDTEIAFFRDLMPNVFNITIKQLDADMLFSDYLNGTSHDIASII